MPVIELQTAVAAPIAVVFDLTRSIDLHAVSTSCSGEVAVAGCTTGLIGLGQQVTFEATHFGIRQQLTAEVVQYDRRHHFRDTMLRGAFRRFDHDHDFAADGDTTLMTDRFDYTSSFGFLGRFADTVYLKRYMTGLLRERAEVIRRVAESDEWTSYLPTDNLVVAPE